jgi:hypothetical protein
MVLQLRANINDVSTLDDAVAACNPGKRIKGQTASIGGAPTASD